MCTAKNSKTVYVLLNNQRIALNTPEHNCNLFLWNTDYSTFTL